MIKGVLIKQLKVIPDERGLIMQMMRNDDAEYKKFGEIYFSSVYPGVVKGWHLHTQMTLNYATISGMIKLVLYDDRKDVSPGAKFADCDLIGCPIRLVISPKTGDKIEYKERSKKEFELLTIEEVVARLKNNS